MQTVGIVAEIPAVYKADLLIIGISMHIGIKI